MNLVYTDAFTLTDTEVLLQRGGTPGGGVIPNTLSVRSIYMIPDKVGASFPDYYIKGIHGNSNWRKVDGASPGTSLSGLDDGPSIYMYIKAAPGETITMNLDVHGQVN